MKKFNEWESRLFKITLGLLLFALVSFGIIAISIDHIRPVAEVLAQFFLIMLFVILSLWVLTIGRIISYLARFRNHEESNGIVKSLVSLLLHPITFIIFYVLVFLSAISGCTIS